MRLISDIIRAATLSVLVGPPREPEFTPTDFIRSAQGSKRRKVNPATKDRSQTKAARKQRQKEGR